MMYALEEKCVVYLILLEFQDEENYKRCGLRKTQRDVFPVIITTKDQ